MSLRKLSAAEQASRYLEAWITAQKPGTKLPGVDKLSSDMGVSRDTVRAALKSLEASQWIKPGGNGKARVTPDVVPRSTKARPLKVVILPDRRVEYFATSLASQVLLLQRHIQQAGHQCDLAAKSLADFAGDVGRIRRFTSSVAADVWIVMSAPRPVLEWFMKQPFTTIAWGGWHRALSLPGSGSSMAPAVQAAARDLLQRGHKRIVMFCHPMLRAPVAGPTVQAFKDELEAAGVPFVNGFHVPDFESTPAGLESVLQELFKVTPPTAVIVTMHTYQLALMTFLQSRRLRVPEDVSVVAGYEDAKLDWMLPKMATFRVHQEKIVRRIIRWVDARARGRPVAGCVTFDVDYVPGDSVADPPPRGSAS